MKKLSAGLLLFRRPVSTVEVFLVHPGGPFWERKDLGSWSLPKGEYQAGEDPFAVALREFEEETGFKLAPGEYVLLGEIKQPSGKIITAWALEHDLDATAVKSNLFELEWPPKSGKQEQFPEVDRARWFGLPVAQQKILKGQAGFLAALAKHLGLPESVFEGAHNNEADGDSPVQSSLF